MDMPEGADLELSDRVARMLEVAICREDGRLPGLNADPAECYSRNKAERTRTLATGRRFEGPTDIANIKHIY
jgi:hypothetical protein